MSPALAKGTSAAAVREALQDSMSRLELETLAADDLVANPKLPVGPSKEASADDSRALEIVNHLLWHKALIDEDEDGTRLDEYIELVRTSEKGEHHTIRDQFHRSIAIAFELVLQEHLNPWKIDLGQFSRLYLERAQEEELDLVMSGRIILMAWTVLKLQSDDVVELAERLTAPEPEADMDFLDWGDIGEWDYDDEGYEYTRRVKYAPQAPIDEKVRRTGATRKVTLMELVDAFEEVRREAENRQVMAAERARTRALLRAQADDSVAEMMHEDDPEEEQARIWDQILQRNGSPIGLAELYRPEIDSFVTAFNSILFLAAENRIELWQEDFPFGPIMVKNALIPSKGDPNGASAESGDLDGVEAA